MVHRFSRVKSRTSSFSIATRLLLILRVIITHVYFHISNIRLTNPQEIVWKYSITIAEREHFLKLCLVSFILRRDDQRAIHRLVHMHGAASISDDWTCASSFLDRASSSYKTTSFRAHSLESRARVRLRHASAGARIIICVSALSRSTIVVVTVSSESRSRAVKKHEVSLRPFVLPLLQGVLSLASSSRSLLDDEVFRTRQTK